MNHEEALQKIRLRSEIKKLEVDEATKKRLLSEVEEPKSVPWDLVSDVIKDREVAVSEGSVLDNMIAYYSEALASVEWRLYDALELKDEISSRETPQETPA